MFYDIFCALCAERHISKTKATLDAGLSNATATKWKKTGAVPDSATLSKLASYFGVSIDYLLGLTADSFMLGTQYRLEQAEKAYNAESDPDRKMALASEIDILRESLEDQMVTSMLQSRGTEPDFGRAAFFSDDFPNLTEAEKNGLWKEAQDYARYRASLLKKGSNGKDGRD